MKNPYPVGMGEKKDGDEKDGKPRDLAAEVEGLSSSSSASSSSSSSPLDGRVYVYVCAHVLHLGHQNWDPVGLQGLLWSSRRAPVGLL